MIILGSHLLLLHHVRLAEDLHGIDMAGVDLLDEADLVVMMMVVVMVMMLMMMMVKMMVMVMMTKAMVMVVMMLRKAAKHFFGFI